MLKERPQSCDSFISFLSALVSLKESFGLLCGLFLPVKVGLCGENVFCCNRVRGEENSWSFFSSSSPFCLGRRTYCCNLFPLQLFLLLSDDLRWKTAGGGGEILARHLGQEREETVGDNEVGPEEDV